VHEDIYIDLRCPIMVVYNISFLECSEDQVGREEKSADTAAGEGHSVPREA